VQLLLKLLGVFLRRVHQLGDDGCDLRVVLTRGAVRDHADAQALNDCCEDEDRHRARYCHQEIDWLCDVSCRVELRVGYR
jgi:hypothetical protein